MQHMVDGTRNMQQLYAMCEAGPAQVPAVVGGGVVGLTCPYPAQAGERSPSAISTHPEPSAEPGLSPRDGHRFGDVAGVIMDQPLVQILTGNDKASTETQTMVPLPQPSAPAPPISIAEGNALERATANLHR